MTCSNCKKLQIATISDWISTIISFPTYLLFSLLSTLSDLKHWLLFMTFVRPDLWVTLCDADTPEDASGKRIAKSVRQGARQSFFSVSRARVADPDLRESAFPARKKLTRL